MKIQSLMFILFFLLLAWAAPLLAEDPTECDLQAGHPSDPQHIGPGVSSGAMILQKAIPACREAVAADPESARAQYQLARSLVYWADANGADISEGMKHLEIAAAKNYTQALFVLGLMLQRQGKTCEVEPVTRKAADQGLKSARLSYVDHVVSGLYSGCAISASKAQMQAYLDAATGQVSGYYENMLVGALKRELDVWQP